MTDPETPLRTLHQQFCTLTGRQYRFEQWRHDWYDFVRCGYTADDMTAVIEFANRVNARREKRYQIVVTLAKIITDLRNFDSLRAEADLARRELAAKRRQVLPEQSAIELAAMRHEQAVTPEQPVKRVSLGYIAETLKRANQ